ncbi:hypothetical protein MFIFM68171_11249 [Madurella fahalii]|uniref:Uncharacterized protein n=1 Tax=Madurella fahalii TaxID=1157608 RepID=A0ABQ0GTN4_9PEZI
MQSTMTHEKKESILHRVRHAITSKVQSKSANKVTAIADTFRLDVPGDNTFDWEEYYMMLRLNFPEPLDDDYNPATFHRPTPTEWIRHVNVPPETRAYMLSRLAANRTAKALMDTKDERKRKWPYP